jgi:hypothetical protein
VTLTPGLVPGGAAADEGFMTSARTARILLVALLLALVAIAATAPSGARAHTGGPAAAGARPADPCERPGVPPSRGR